jgi:hypothetical protein
MPTRHRREQDRSRNWEPSPNVLALVAFGNGRRVSLRFGDKWIAVNPLRSASALAAFSYWSAGLRSLIRRGGKVDPATIDGRVPFPSSPPLPLFHDESFIEWVAALGVNSLAYQALREVQEHGAWHRIRRCRYSRWRAWFIADHGGQEHCRPAHTEAARTRQRQPASRRAYRRRSP